ncbi:MAG: HNH endonuclease [Candidatus Cloacimonetes bacterium]|nr:HNH endonuclease [Candidatus Cloacimonadota bacterium]
MKVCRFCSKQLPGYLSNKRVCQCCRISMARTVGKLRAIALKGGRCENCGSKVHPAAFEFHHTNPETKGDGIGNLLNGRWSEVEKELKKCELLCSNCHAERHAIRFNKFAIDAITSSKAANGKVLYLDWLGEKVANEMKEKMDRLNETEFAIKEVKCENCGNSFIKKSNRNRKYCSQKCSRIAKRKVERPPVSQILEDLKVMSFVKVGKKYGVSDNSIRKWIKSVALV